VENASQVKKIYCFGQKEYTPVFTILFATLENTHLKPAREWRSLNTITVFFFFLFELTIIPTEEKVGECALKNVSFEIQSRQT
jgi:hypothetical protein